MPDSLLFKQSNPGEIRLAVWAALLFIFDGVLGALVTSLKGLSVEGWSLTTHLMAIAAALITGLMIQSYNHRKETFQFFRRLGIPGPRPNLIKGNGDLLRNPSLLTIEVMDAWQNEFGDLYGYFMGLRPYLVVRDLDMVQQVLISEFHKFVNRPHMGIELFPVVNTLVGLRGQRWKEVRSVISPTFSRKKMRKISMCIQQAVDVLVDVVGQQSANNCDINFYDAFQGLTCQVISECALNMPVDCQRNPADPFLNSLRQFMKSTANNPIIDLAIYFPLVKKILAIICMIFSPIGQFTLSIIDSVQKAINDRRSCSADEQKPNDILQLLLNAAENKSGDQNHSDSDCSTSSSDSGTLGRKKYLLSDDEIVANAWVFLLGGFETTANALGYAAWLLATNPDIQDKVYEEILTHFGDGIGEDYDKVNSLVYMDQVLCETLRLFPPVVHLVTREASEPVQLGKTTIPAGTNIQIPVWQIHHDPNLWPDPYSFDPDRFDPELKKSHHPMSWIPFGSGPRACIGIRFAMLEAKITLAKLLMKYRLVPCSRTEEKPTLSVVAVTLNPKDGVWLRAEARPPIDRSLY